MRTPTLALAAAVAILTAAPLTAQPSDTRTAADRLIDAALADSSAYARLGVLVDRFGHRLSGSASLERAIDWIVAEMRKEGYDSVYTQPVSVPRWVRGVESATLVSPRPLRLHMLGLGGSVGTPTAGITAPVLVVRNFEELRARAAEVKGRIVLYNQPWEGYGRSVRYRSSGADSAAALGAVAVLVRSVTDMSLRTPHTGAVSYRDTTRRIPAAAISVEEAELLQRMSDRGERITVRLRMGARIMPRARSRNVIAEIRGSELPDEVVVMGGHIDSWDVGQGAMDDAGGCVATWEALRLIKAHGVRPKRTIRVVLWTNEENGLAGANAYRDAVRDRIEQHVLAMESDNGVFRPRGVSFAGTDSGLAMMREIARPLARIGADSVAAGSAQADTGPLNRLGVPTAAAIVDGSRYFWYHHTEADMLDKLDPRELGLNVAVYAVLAWGAANGDVRVPKAPVRAEQ